MIYVTGDTHGNFLGRLDINAFPEQKEMTRNDFVIILGDFGGVWDNSLPEKYCINLLEDDKPFTTLFIDGNHENHNLLNSYPVSMWNGGKVHYIRPHVIHLMRGQVFNIEGKKFFTFGGARSHDITDGILEANDPRIIEWNKENKLFRINHVSWWKEEMPSEEEMDEGLENLEKNNYKVDFVLTHCGPSSTVALFSHGYYKPDPLTNYLEKIRQKTEFKRWFMGHYHDNYMINDKEIILYEQIMRIA